MPDTGKALRARAVDFRIRYGRSCDRARHPTGRDRRESGRNSRELRVRIASSKNARLRWNPFEAEPGEIGTNW